MSAGLPAVAGRRRNADRAARAALLALTLVALVPLVLIVLELLRKGLGAWSWTFFTSDPTARFLPDPGAIRSAIIGSVGMGAMATAIVRPIGIGAALYHCQYC